MIGGEGAINFTVHGHPEPAGSKKAYVIKGRAVVTDANAKSKPWKQQVAAVALEVMNGREVLTGPVGLTCVFYRSRPKGHYGSGKNSEKVKESAPRFPVTKPDATKLLRGVEDALTGIVYRDDAQIIAQSVLKRYGEPERVEVTVMRAEP